MRGEGEAWVAEELYAPRSLRGLALEILSKFDLVWIPAGLP